MGGVAGFLGLPCQERRVTVLRRMLASLTHRGPHGQGCFFDESVGLGLGYRQLAVEHSSCGKQPLVSSSGRYAIVFDGEIYNTRAIRQRLCETRHTFCEGSTTTHVVLSAIEEWGIAASVEEFIGRFALAVWDRRSKELVLVRDRIGKKPLYYGFLGKGFAFASRLSALVQYPDWEPTIDRRALTAYMRHSYVPAPLSIYQQVRKLPPAHILRVGLRSGRPVELELVRYWDAARIQRRARENPFAGSWNEAVEALETLLTDATKLRMADGAPLGAFLSGGVDSALVTALMCTHASSPVRTFTIGFEESSYDEAAHAKAIAKHLGTVHTEFYARPRDALAGHSGLPRIYDEPFADSSQIPTYLASALAHQHVAAVFTGDGGDEGFCGYNRYLWWRRVSTDKARLPSFLVGLFLRAIQRMSAQSLDRLAQAIYPILPPRMQFTAPGDRLHRLARLLAIHRPQDLYRHLVSYWVDPEQVVIDGAEPRDLSTRK